MGCSWALYFSREIISHQRLVARGQTEDILVRDKNPAPAMQPGSPVLGVYVDNVRCFGGKQGGAVAGMAKVAERFEVDNMDTSPGDPIH